jgi:hypothetical protein
MTLSANRSCYSQELLASSLRLGLAVCERKRSKKGYDTVQASGERRGEWVILG